MTKARITFLVLVLPGLTGLARAQTLEATLTASDSQSLARFGAAISGDGDLVAVGAPGHDSSRGKVYVFKRIGGDWSEVARLQPASLSPDDRFGTALVLAGDILIVGAPGDDDGGTEAGSVYSYAFQGPHWVLESKTTASDADSFDRYGEYVASDGMSLLVGAPGADEIGTNSGIAYHYFRASGAWQSTQKLGYQNAAPNSKLGPVAVQGEYAVVGAPNYPGPPFNLEGFGGIGLYRWNGSFWDHLDSELGMGEFMNLGYRVSFQAEVICVMQDGGPYCSGDFWMTYKIENSAFVSMGDGDCEAGDAAAHGGLLVQASDPAEIYEHGPQGWVLRYSVPYGGDEVAVYGSKYFLGNPVADSGAPSAGAVYAYSHDNASIVAYCHCDVGAPCMNESSEGGCLTAAGVGGIAEGFGTTRVSLDDFEIHASQLPTGEWGVFFMSLGQTSLPFGNGRLCVGGIGAQAFRFPPMYSGTTGTISMGPGLVAYSSTFGASGVIDAGETWNFQCWFRDPGGACGASFNLSNALQVGWIP